MKKSFMFVIIAVALLLSSVALAKDSIENAFDYVVTLTDASGQYAYCSGVIMRGADKESYLVSAGHCFGFAIVNGINIYYKMGETVYDAGAVCEDDLALYNDVAAIKTPIRHKSKIVAASNWDELQTVLMITKFPKYANDPELAFQLMTIMGIYEKDFTINYTNGDLRPGMSGSPVFDAKMRVVGLTIQTVDAIRPVGFITPLTNTVFPDKQDRFAWSKSKKAQDRRLRIPEKR